MEQQWIDQARDGDMAAFDELARLYERKIYGLALRMCGNTDNAFDIAQDALFSLYKSLPYFKGECAFSTWVYRLTANAAIDFSRRRKKEARLWLHDEDGDEYLTEIPDFRYDPASEYDRTALREAIESALLKLKPEYRIAFILRELHGLTYAEMADALECEEGTVKSRLFRARAQLRKLLTLSGNFPG